MSPFTPAASTLSNLSARFQDIAGGLTHPTPGQGRTVDAVDERNSARTITANRLADWAYTASATAREQADIDSGLERAPSPATISALADVCHATAGNDPAALLAYQAAGAERMAAKKAHAAQTASTTWPEAVTPAPMPSTCGVGDDRPVGDGFGGEGVEDPTQSETDTPVTMSEPAGEPETPVTMSTGDTPAASATAPTVSDTAAGTSLSADTLPTDSASRTGTLSNPPATTAPSTAAGQPSPTVTGPTGGVASQLGQPQNGVRQGATGRRPAQTRKEGSREPARDTTFDPLIAGTSGAALGVVGGAHSAAGLPSTPSTSTSGAPTAPTAPSTPNAAPSGGQGTGPMGGGPMARPMGSGSTVAPTSSTPPPPTIVAAEVDPSIDPLKADPSDLDWTPPTISNEEKKS